MRKRLLGLLLVSPALLVACATAPAQTPVHGETPGHICKLTGTERFIGQPGNSETGAAILRATKAAVLRWAPPGYMMTMDYRSDRVTVYLGADYKIAKINCG
jgi:hypothetical protein